MFGASVSELYMLIKLLSERTVDLCVSNDKACMLVFYDKLQEHAKYEPEVIYGTSRLMS